MDGKSDTSSIATDSAIGRSSVITGTTAKETQYSEVSRIDVKHMVVATLHEIINRSSQHVYRRCNYSVQLMMPCWLPCAHAQGVK